MPEVRRLLQALPLPAAERHFHLHWSWWRRAHQAVASCCHAARRARSPSLLPHPPSTPTVRAAPTARPPAEPAAAAFPLTDAQWERVADLLPVRTGTGKGRPARQQRQHLEGLLWLRQTGASWRSLPAAYGKWETLYACYRAWQATGLWQYLLDRLAIEDSEVSL